MERKFYAKAFDMHFSGEDCPYVCEEYEQYKAVEKDGTETDGSQGS